MTRFKTEFEAERAMIDIDNLMDFLHSLGAMYIPGGQGNVGPSNTLTKHGYNMNDLNIFVREDHPINSKHFKKNGGAWDDHGVSGTPGAEPMVGLLMTMGPRTYIVYKGTDPDNEGYDAFDGKTRQGLSLEEILDAHGVKELFFKGVALQFCIETAVLTACGLGKYKVYVVEDACVAIKDKKKLSPGKTEKEARERMQKAGAIMVTVSEVLDGSYKNKTA